MKPHTPFNSRPRSSLMTSSYIINLEDTENETTPLILENSHSQPNITNFLEQSGLSAHVSVPKYSEQDRLLTDDKGLQFIFVRYEIIN